MVCTTRPVSKKRKPIYFQQELRDDIESDKRRTQQFYQWSIVEGVNITLLLPYFLDSSKRTSDDEAKLSVSYPTSIGRLLAKHQKTPSINVKK